MCFFETQDLDAAGIKGIVRMGGSSKEPRLDGYNVRNLAKRHSRSSFTAEDSRRSRALRSRLVELNALIKQNVEKLEMQHAGSWDRSWDLVGPFLETHDHATWLQLRIQPPAIAADDGAGVEPVGRGQRAAPPDALWRAWRDGKQPQALGALGDATLAAVAVAVAGGGESVWALNVGVRWILTRHWAKEIFAGRRMRLAELMAEHAQVPATGACFT